MNAFASTYDPHTQYFSPRTSQNFNINMSLSLEGIGAVLRNEDEYTSVVELVPAGPADKSGLISRPIASSASARAKRAAHRRGRLAAGRRGRADPRSERFHVRLEIIPDARRRRSTKVIQITRNTVKLEEQAAQKQVLD